jgi:hypothetical protein
MANRNRTAGHNYERLVTKELNKYYSVVTARSESRNKDNLGIDIFDTSGEMPFHVQCKVSMGLSSSKINELLNRGDGKRPMVVFHKHVEKKGERFLPKGEYVYMDKKFFYFFLEKLKELYIFENT